MNRFDEFKDEPKPTAANPITLESSNAVAQFNNAAKQR
jgi:hypothetical protein